MSLFESTLHPNSVLVTTLVATTVASAVVVVAVAVAVTVVMVLVAAAAAVVCRVADRMPMLELLEGGGLEVAFETSLGL